jgi:hypothetical protein
MRCDCSTVLRASATPVPPCMAVFEGEYIKLLINVEHRQQQPTTLTLKHLFVQVVFKYKSKII